MTKGAGACEIDELELVLHIHRKDGKRNQIRVVRRLDTGNEIRYDQSDGILNYMLKRLI